MRKTILGIAAALVLVLSSCTQRAAGSGSEDTPETVAASVQDMYDDVLSMYNTGKIMDDHDYAKSKYASSALRNLEDELVNAIDSGEIDPMIYGWDCDPWILAQDWISLSAEVESVYDLTADSCKADVTIKETGTGIVNGTRTVTLMLVKENGQWKVDDFAEGADRNTYASQLRSDFEDAIGK